MELAEYGARKGCRIRCAGNGALIHCDSRKRLLERYRDYERAAEPDCALKSSLYSDQAKPLSGCRETDFFPEGIPDIVITEVSENDHIVKMSGRTFKEENMDIVCVFPCYIHCGG